MYIYIYIYIYIYLYLLILYIHTYILILYICISIYINIAIYIYITYNISHNEVIITVAGFVATHALGHMRYGYTFPVPMNQRMLNKLSKEGSISGHK